MTGRYDIEALKQIDLVEVVKRYGVEVRRAGRWIEARCPFHEEKTPSFKINTERNTFRCYGCDAHGDVIDFVAQIEGVELKEAMAQLAGDAPANAPAPKRTRFADDRADHLSKVQAARKMWRNAQSAPGTPAMTYLCTRVPGLIDSGVMIPPSLRFLPHCLHKEAGRSMPAMIAPIQAVSGEVIGVHRTYLMPDGSGKADVKQAKKVLGAMRGGAIRLAPVAETLLVAEGIETTLSCMVAMAKVGRRLNGWCAVSLGNLAGAGDGQGNPHPDQSDKRLPSEAPDMKRPAFLPPVGTRELIIMADNDGKDPLIGRAITRRAARRFNRMGLKVKVCWPPRGEDFNDRWVEHINAAAPID